MKSICPTCKGSLYLPDDNQSSRKWSVLCTRCHAIYMATPGTVIGVWLSYSNRHRVVYQARIHLQTGSTKTVALEQQINNSEPVILVTPLKGLGKLKPILLLETENENSHLLIHPRQQVRLLQIQGAIWTAILVLYLGLSLKGAVNAIVIVAMVSSFAVATTISRVSRGAENNPQIRGRLFLEQQLIKHSIDWGQRLYQLEKELSNLQRVNQSLRPYDEKQLFRIDSLSKNPRERRYFEDRYHRLSELIERYQFVKDLIDTNIPIIQLTKEVPLNLVDQFLDLAQEIEYLEEQYRVNE